MRDITDRLRGLVPHCEDHSDYTEDDLMILQSAKEIERLREENDELRQIVKEYQRAMGFKVDDITFVEKE